MDIGRAFAYVFDDDDWVKKILIGGLISIIPLLGEFIIYGYMTEIARRSYRQGDVALPEWDDIGGYLARGFLFWLGLVIWALPFILFFACSFLMAILFGLGSGEEAVLGLSILLIYVVIFPMVLLFALAAALVVPVLLGRYAAHGRFGALFEFGEIIAEVRRIGLGPILLLTVTYLAAGYIGQIGVMFCLVGVLFTGFYGRLAIAHAAGQVHRMAFTSDGRAVAAPTETIG